MNNSALVNTIAAWQNSPIDAPHAWISGKEWTDTANTVASVSPINGSLLGHIVETGVAGVAAAVASARASYEKRTWAGMARRDRKRVLLRFADLITANVVELGVLQCRDMGMPVNMAINMDATLAANCIRWYGEAIDKVTDEMVPMSDTELGLIARCPLGVVGAIIPWNFPLMIAAWKIGPAMAMGNSVVLKPAEDATLAVLKLARLATEAGIPDGVLNVIPGTGQATGSALALHNDVDGLTFTGSGAVGRKMLEYSAQSNMKRVSLECGGKTANIVFADAPNLEEAVQAAARAVFRNQGQVCNAPTRLLVERSIEKDFLDRVIAVAATLKTGDPLDTSNDLGPLVNAKQLRGVRAAIDKAEAEGTEIVLDGRGVSAEEGGFYVGPTIARNVDPRSALAQEEIFGPVLSVIDFDGPEEAIAIANGTRYGLGAMMWTRDLLVAHEVADRLVAGSVVINGSSGLLIEMPFGGFKESGFGRDSSLHALEKYSDLKSVLVRRAARKTAA